MVKFENEYLIFQCSQTEEKSFFFFFKRRHTNVRNQFLVG